ncbi:MAG: NAD(P)H-hydrate dehydratase [bacterium]|jgi:hydroxyethylthiazole kinase-like uncharacterized protein yjeF
MKVATGAEMRRIDGTAMAYGLSGAVLMENAGLRVVGEIRRQLGGLVGRRVVIIAGPGKNGGDGFVAARHLHRAGAAVRVFRLPGKKDATAETSANLALLQLMSVSVETVPDAAPPPGLEKALAEADAVVDALLGTGLRGKPEGVFARMVEKINACGRTVIAVDIPSGLDADTGEIRGNCVRATSTVVLALPKPGVLLYPGAEYAGQIVVADISIPAELTENLRLNLITRDLVRRSLPARRPDTHKGDYGRALLVAGARGYLGAAVLAAMGAMRAGSGLVTLALPVSLQSAAAVKLTEAMTRGLAETAAGSLSLAAFPAIAGEAAAAQALAVGPGLTTQPETVSLVRRIVTELTVPKVLDADALNAVAEDTTVLKEAAGPVILTPHGGEMARLLGCTAADVRADRLGIARLAADAWRAIVVLKGARTIIAAPGGDTYINFTGNPGMATGGSGDVLTGVIAGLLAQGQPPLAAAVTGVFLHGSAGDRVVTDRGETGLVAGDLPAELPAAFRAVRQYESADTWPYYYCD